VMIGCAALVPRRGAPLVDRGPRPQRARTPVPIPSLPDRKTSSRR